jgi:hypothetical protein
LDRAHLSPPATPTSSRPVDPHRVRNHHQTRRRSGGLTPNPNCHPILQQSPTTEDHPFWNETDQQWQDAQELNQGDRLYTVDGSEVRASGLTWTTSHVGKAYNLTVSDLHTYYVTVGNTWALVHNCGLGNSTNSAAKRTTYPLSEAGEPLAGGRTTGINRAWNQERDLLNAGGGTRDWTADEARELWMNGTVDGYTGHHMNSVEAFPEWRGDPRNIRFLTNGKGTNEHLYSPLGHAGVWQNPTAGDLIDRPAMIEQLLGAK